MSTAVINVLTTICLIWIIFLIFAVILKIAKMIKNKDAAKLYGFLKGFKKGSCFLIYFASVPLYFCAIYYTKGDFAYSIFYAIERSVRLIVLYFNYSDFSALVAVNAYFAAVVYVCLTAVILNAILFTVSLAGMRGLNFLYRIKALHQKQNVYILAGLSKSNKQIIRSISREKDGKKGEYSIILVNKADIGKKDELNLLMLENKTAYAEYSSGNFCAVLEKVAMQKHWKSKCINIIINTEDDCENLLLTKELKKFTDDHPEITHNILNRRGVNGYVFCQPQNISTFNFYVENSHGAIQYLNKYRLVAMDFITRYPLTKYMTNEIDERYPALKKGAEVNFIMIGFGKQNRQMFHTSVSTQQFLTVDGGKTREKPVHYCIYDKIDSNADLILNHNYYRYGNFLKMNKNRLDKFLPLPELPADVQFHKMNISDREFYGSLRSDLSGENKYSYIVIALGSDMENMDFGQKIAVKLKEWNIQGKVKLFVKINNGKLLKDAKNEDIIFFGDESAVVYDIETILHEKIELLAKGRSLLYSMENAKESDRNTLEVRASEKWYKQSQCQRESNIYACLSLRNKLNLLGFDIQKKGETKQNAADEFIKKYQSGDPIRYTKTRENGRREIEYLNADFDRDSIRKYCAVLEHQRWNANYISWGFVPATKKEIAESSANGKDFTIRRHGCLTTFDGLKGYREIVAAKDKNPDASEKDKLEAADVIRYDYQIMDDVLWLLDNSGYEIVKRNYAQN